MFFHFLDLLLVIFKLAQNTSKMLSTIGFTQLCTVQRLLNAEAVSVVSRDMIMLEGNVAKQFLKAGTFSMSRNDQPAMAQIGHDQLQNFT